MYPYNLHVWGHSLSIWNAVFLFAVLVGALIFNASARDGAQLTGAMARYAVVAYLSALAAQLFAYLFDVSTSLSPTSGQSIWSYYFDPLSGPKTLYGVIVLLPVSVGCATLGTKVSLKAALDLWTPAMLTVLAIVRVGCLLQGCCYGVRSDAFGISFPAGSSVYAQQLQAGLIAEGARSLPVVPTQALEAFFLALLAGWAIRSERQEARRSIFVGAVLWYSVFRFLVEFARADVGRGYYGPLTTSQWIALAVISLAMAAESRARRSGSDNSGRASG